MFHVKQFYQIVLCITLTACGGGAGGNDSQTTGNTQELELITESQFTAIWTGIDDDCGYDLNIAEDWISATVKIYALGKRRIPVASLSNSAPKSFAMFSGAIALTEYKTFNTEHFEASNDRFLYEFKGDLVDTEEVEEFDVQLEINLSGEGLINAVLEGYPFGIVKGTAFLRVDDGVSTCQAFWLITYDILD